MLYLLLHTTLGYQTEIAQAVYNAGQAVAQAWGGVVQSFQAAMDANCPCL